MLGKTFKKKINLKYYFFPTKLKEDILIARDILYAPTVRKFEIRCLYVGKSLIEILPQYLKW